MIDFVIDPTLDRSVGKRHKKHISLDTKGESNTQTSSPRLPQSAYLPKMAVIRDNLDRNTFNRPMLKSRREIHHIGFNKLLAGTQKEESDRYRLQNSLLRKPRFNLADLNYSKERYEVSPPNSILMSQNTSIFLLLFFFILILNSDF